MDHPRTSGAPATCDAAVDAHTPRFQRKLQGRLNALRLYADDPAVRGGQVGSDGAATLQAAGGTARRADLP